MSDESGEYKPEPCAWCKGTKTMWSWTAQKEINCTACRAQGVVLVLQPSQNARLVRAKVIMGIL
jgi:hypothetical protein